MKILLDNASFASRGSVLLKDLTFNLEDESYYLNGPMASGKSTLLRALALKLPLIAGDRKILHKGHEISNSNFLSLTQFVDISDSLTMSNNRNGFYQQRYHVGMEGQNPKLSQYLTWFGWKKSNAYHNKLLTGLGLSILLDRHLIHLSSGQLIKMLIVKSLLKHPQALFLDNPFAGLDAASCKVLQDTMWALHHDFNIQLFVTGRANNVPEFINNEISLKNNTIMRVGNRRAELGPLPEINESIVHQVIGYNDENRNALKKGNILEFKNVNVQYLSKPILKNISFTLTYGERIAILGTNGSGKSTLFSLISGDHPLAYANEIYIFGNRRGSGESIWFLKKNMGCVSPELRMNTDGSHLVDEVLLRGFFGSYHPNKKITESDKDFVDLLLSYFDLQNLKFRSFGSLSSGEQQLIIFIRSLAQLPPLLLLDEPYQNLDWSTIIKCNFLLTALARQRDISIMFISHCQEEIPNIVNKYYEIKNGTLLNLSRDPLNI